MRKLIPNMGPPKSDLSGDSWASFSLDKWVVDTLKSAGFELQKFTIIQGPFQ